MLVDARKGVHFGEPFLFEIPRSANGQLMLIATSNLIFHRANHLCAWIDYFTGNLRKFKFEKHPNWSPIILLGYFSSRNLVTNKPGTSWGSGNFTNFLGYDRHVKYGMSREWWDILYNIYISVVLVSIFLSHQMIVVILPMPFQSLEATEASARVFAHDWHQGTPRPESGIVRVPQSLRRLGVWRCYAKIYRN